MASQPNRLPSHANDDTQPNPDPDQTTRNPNPDGNLTFDPSDSPSPSSPKPFAALCRREETKRVVTMVQVSLNDAKHKPDPFIPHHQKEMVDS
jgi:hypothetical protein